MKGNASKLLLWVPLAAALIGTPARGQELPRATRTTEVARAPLADLDWVSVRAWTRKVEEARHRHRIDGDAPILAPHAPAIVAAAREAVGERPGFFGRLAFPFAPDTDERSRLGEAQAALEQLQRDLPEAMRAAESAIALALQRAEGDQEHPSLRARLEPLRAEAKQRGEEASALLAEAVASLRLARGGFGDRFRLWARRIAGNDAASALAALDERLRAWNPPRASVLGADLTYVHGTLTPPPLPTTTIEPAYATGVGGYELEDTTQGREIEASPEITAKAAELGSAKAAYEFVKNEARLDWYYGSLKGTTETLREMRGNDVDLSALLIALLRAQDTPARYVRGTVEMSIGRIAELMGLLTAEEVAAIEAGSPAPQLARDRVLSALPAAGVPFEPIIRGGAPVAVRFLHTWVQAYLPYGDYRGVGRGAGPRQWVALDPALPAKAKYAAVAPVMDGLVLAGGSAATITEDYVTSGTAESPLAFVRARVDAALASYPGVTYDQLLRGISQQPEILPYVPGTLPYDVVAVHDELAFMPDDAKHRVRISVVDGTGTVLETVFPLHAAVGRRTILTFKPATGVDEATIALSGGLYAAPASAVQVLPVLRIGGYERAVGTRSMGLGVTTTWRMELLLPDGSSRVVSNDVVAGNVVAIGFGGPRNGYREDDAGGPLDGPAARFLYGRAAAYANAWTDAEEELAKLLQVVPLRPTASLVVVENQLAVDEALGVRRRVVWKGLQVDADHRTMVPLDLVSGRGRDLLRLSGFHGSFLEAQVLTEGTGEQAVAAVSVLQEAHRRGVPLLVVTRENATTELPKLATTAEIRREVEDQLARGREVTIPAQDLAIRNWTGTGFVARDRRTEEAGYFLSGVVSGGQTIVSPGSWLDQELVAALQSPEAPDSTDDVTEVARIVKVLATDLQVGIVGEPLAKALTVYVTNLSGRPVRGAKVTFRSLGASQPMFHQVGNGLIPSETFTTHTDASGAARVAVRPATDIRSFAYLEKGTPYEELRGLNQITAETSDGTNTIILNEPFYAFGLPGPAARVEMPCSTATSYNYCQRAHYGGIETGNRLTARLVDAHGNWIANRPVQWRGELQGGRFVDETTGAAPDMFVLDPTDVRQVQQLVLTTRTDGTVVTRYIPPVVAAELLPASFHLWAAAEGVDPGVYRFTLMAPAADECLVQLVADDGASFDGLHGTRFRAPIGAQVLRWTPDQPRPWTAATLTASIRPSVTMTVTNLSTTAPEVLRIEEQVPGASVPDSRFPSVYNPVTAAFWPEYEVDDGLQRHAFEGRLRVDDVTKSCGNAWITSVSGKPTIATRRILPGYREQATDAYGYASSDDLGIAFEVTNPAGYELYAKIVQRPRVAGETVFDVPDPASGQPPRKPDDPEYIRIHAGAASTIRLLLTAGTHGGDVLLELYDADPYVGALAPAGYAKRIRVAPPGIGILSDTDELRAQVILPVRNYESMKSPLERPDVPEGTTTPPDGLRDAAVLVPATLEFRVKGTGRVDVTLGDTLVAAAHVQADQDGNVLPGGLAPVAPDVPMPALTPTGALRTSVPPSDPTIGNVTIAFDDGLEIERREVAFRTDFDDAGAQPVGHTFVKDVNVADGHIAKNAQDLSVPGRGPQLAMTRSYTSRGFEASPLGQGWTHGYRSFVVRDGGPGPKRYLVVGGEGSGQAFTCLQVTLDGSGCTAQRGYHGKLAETASGFIYTARSGTKYEYGRSVAFEHPPRWYLTAIEDAAGSRIELQYPATTGGRELQAVYEAGYGRALWFTYEQPPGADRPQLRTVELVRNERAARVATESDAAALERLACIRYHYDARQNLTSAARYDGACEDLRPPARVEGYAYVASNDRAAQNNLATHTDPNGVVTRYEYYQQSESLPGETGFTIVADKIERVKRVIEPAAHGRPEAVTEFVYSLETEQQGIAASSVLTYLTTVRGPRPGAETRYRLEPYGSASVVERVLDGSGRVAVSRTLWDSDRRRPILEEDPRGRRTHLSYDVRGNLIARRVETLALPARDGAPATEPLVDGAGIEVTEVIERWAYHPEFGGEACHVDPEGRVKVSQYDSATGLLLSSREYATPLPAPLVRDRALGCDELALNAQVSAQDVVATHAYCMVADGACATNAVRGDLTSTTTGARTAEVTAYDAYGNASATRIAVGPSYLVKETFFDHRSRPYRERDSLGHETWTTFDALDRPVAVNRLNSKTPTPGKAIPGEHRTFAYYPGGQIKEEKVWTGPVNMPGVTAQAAEYLVRTYALDPLNRPAGLVESGSGTPAPLVTTFTYDEAGNNVGVTDRRGIETRTYFDLGDRPYLSTVVDPDGACDRKIVTNHPVPAHECALAEFSHDPAGNRLAEADLHGSWTTFALDPLYRAVGVTSPEVPGAALDSALTTYQVRRRYDLVGNKVSETDRNGFETTWTYDHENRQLDMVDAVGRFESREYDVDGNLRVERIGHRSDTGATSVHLERFTDPDSLGRPLEIRQQFATDVGVVDAYTTSFRYDDAAHTVEVRDGRGFVTVRELDHLDRVFRETVDTNGSLLTSTPDNGISPRLNLVTTFEYDAGGNRSAVVDPEGRRIDEDYDGLRRVVARRWTSTGVSETFTYDGEGNVTSRNDRRGVVRTTTYDVYGRVKAEALEERWSNGGLALPTITRRYQDTLNGARLATVTETDALGRVTTRKLDALGRALVTTDALGRSEVTRYDGIHKRIVRHRRWRDTDWFRTEYDYDAIGRVVAQRDHEPGKASAAYEQTATYDDAARTETAYDRRYIPTKTSRDGLGRVVAVERGAGTIRIEKTEYDANGNLIRTIDPNGHATASVYDGANRRRYEIVGEGTVVEARTEHRYDGSGNLVWTKGPRGDWEYDAQVAYDDLGRPVRTVDARGNVTSRAFDEAGNKLCEMKPLGGDPIGTAGARGLTVEQIATLVCGTGYVTRYKYDEEGKLVSLVDALGGEYTFVYDEVRNLVAKQDANDDLTTFAYDALNRRTDERQHLSEQLRVRTRSDVAALPPPGPPDPANGTGALHWRVTYDEHANVLTRTDPRNLTTRHSYGILDRLDKDSFVEPGDPIIPVAYPQTVSIDYAYDGNGNVTSVLETKETSAGVFVAETTGRKFDGLDRLEAETRYDGKVIGYAYDLNGNRTRVTGSDESATEYAYDARDRLLTATTPAGVARYRYWPDGLERGKSLPNGVDEGRCYDAAGRLTAIVSATGPEGTVTDACTTLAAGVSEFGYEYDGNGNRLRQLETRRDAATQSLLPIEETVYAYDGLDRLTGVLYPGGRALLYRLDPVGNRTGEREVEGVTGGGVVLASYDPAPVGATVVRDVTARFNRADWLVSQTDALDATREVSYRYDYAGNLVAKVKAGLSRELRWSVRNTLTAVVDGGVEVGRYDYDARGQRVKRATAAESVEYVLDERHVLEEAAGAGAPSHRRYHYAEEPLVVVERTVASFISTDALGSPTDFTSATGAVSTKRQYDAWGQYRNGTAPGTSEPKVGFTGHQYDPETGLVYARARYYDPELGRFISRDGYEGELGDAPSLHRYAYAHGNPLVYVDEEGESATAVGAAVGFAWGVGQAIGGIFNGNVEGVGDFLSVVAQNTIGGLEIGMGIDVTIASGGLLGTSAGGALINAGLSALTGQGGAQGWGAFAVTQVKEGGQGALYGAGFGVLGKAVGVAVKAAAPIVRKVGETAGAQFVQRTAQTAVGKAASTAVGRSVAQGAQWVGNAASRGVNAARAVGAQADDLAARAGLEPLAQMPTRVGAALQQAEKRAGAAVASALRPGSPPALAPGGASAEAAAYAGESGELATTFEAVAGRNVAAGSSRVSTSAARGSGPKLLTAGSRVPNAGGRIISFVTQEQRTFYRVFSGDSRVGSFLTSVKPKNSAFARDALALPPGNTATFVQEVIVPTGTRLQRSRALPAFGRRGGAEQFELLEHIPVENFGAGVPLP